MKKSTAKPPAAVAGQAVTGVAEGNRELAVARSGGMALADLMNHAEAMNRAGRAQDAAELYETWIAHTVSPFQHVACFNWGTLLGALNRHAEAERAYQRALALSPSFMQARLNLGHQLEHLGRHDEAVTEWQKVVDQPDAAIELYLHALNNMARLQEQRRQYDEAERCLRASLARKPAQNDVIQHYVHLRQKKCAWPVYEPVGALTQNQDRKSVV